MRTSRSSEPRQEPAGRARVESRGLKAGAGIGLYLIAALAPVLLMALPPTPPGREIVRELSVGLGFAGAGLLGMQLVISARLRRFTAPFGIDAVYHFHREISYVALALILTHPILLFVLDPALLALLNVFAAPWRARFAVTAVVATAAIVAISVWRKRLRLSYEAWRVLHDVLAVIVLLPAILHMHGVGYHLAIPWKGAFWIAYPLLWGLALAWVRLGKPLWRRTKPYVVTGVRPHGAGVWTLGFRPEGHAGLRFMPGQFAWVTLRRSPFSIEEHPFSFSSAAPGGEAGFDVTIKELGDFTSRIGEVRPGEVAYLDGPFGAFSIDRYGSPAYVFVAGGVGITPVMSILRTAADRGDTTPMYLIFAAKTVEDLVFREDIDALAEDLPLEASYVLERPPEGWEGERGFVTREVIERSVPEVRIPMYFLCGPPVMIEFVGKALEEMGIDGRRIHYERFDLV